MDGVGVLGAVALVIVLLAVLGIALLRGRFDGRIRTALPPARSMVASTVPVLGDVGIALPAEKVTVVQFSGAFCAVCPQARTLVERMLRDHPDIAHVEVDVADHLEAVRVLDIRRTPTLIIVDKRGRAVHRASGMPREAELRQALADLAA